MPLIIPAELITEKNKLYESGSSVFGFQFAGQFAAQFSEEIPDEHAGAFIELLEIQHSGGTIRIANNNEDIIWGGETWIRFRFESGDQGDGDDGENKSVSVRVSNLAGTVQSSIETDPNCLIGDTVIYRLIHTGYLNLGSAIDGYFEILEASATDEWVTFELGLENFYLNAFPRNTYRRNICRYQPHQTDVCNYANSSSCDRSFSTCITLVRSTIYGGQPGIPGGIWNV